MELEIKDDDGMDRWMHEKLAQLDVEKWIKSELMKVTHEDR